MKSVTSATRVLLEGKDPGRVAAQKAALEEAGFSVTVCGGPKWLPRNSCPLAMGERCPWVEATDVVVHDLDLDDLADRTVLRALRRRHPAIPVVLELPEETAREHASLLEGCRVIHPYDMDRLVGAVADAVPATPRPKPRRPLTWFSS